MRETDDGGSIEMERARVSAPWVRLGLRWLSDGIFPPVCLSCQKGLTDHDALCPKCWARVDFIRPPLCDQLGSPMPYDTGGKMISAAAVADPPAFDRARAVGHHTGVLRELIHDLKFSDRHAVRALLSRMMTEAGAELLRDADVVVPVPLSRQRLLMRRFNQSALLAQTVARATSVRYEPELLVRVRATPRQVGLTRHERALNVRGAFAVPPAQKARVNGLRVLLVDDVITTGATCGAAARALKRAGAAAVDVLAVALVTDRAMMEAS